MHRAVLPYWRAKLGHLKLSELTPELIVEHRDRLAAEPFTKARPGAPHTQLKAGEKPKTYRRAPNTVNNYLRPLSKILRLAKREWRWLKVNPMEDVSLLATGKGRVRFLTEDERGRLLAETVKDPQLHTLTVLALATAARAGELLKLAWQDIELGEGRAILGHTKNGEPRATWLHGEARQLLAEHWERQGRPAPQARVFIGEGDKPYSYRDPFGQACERAKVANFTFHCLRHSAATYLARLGATEQQLKAIGGWKSNVVSRYVHLAAEDARGVLEQMTNKILGDPSQGGVGEQHKEAP
jgi:integrase